MNIFATSPCPIFCAQYLDDKRVVKMTLETAQMLSTAITERGGEGPYRRAYWNHPCTKWVRETRCNYDWTLRHFQALCDEYKKRYGRTHACASHLVTFADGADLMPDGWITSFADCSLQDSGDSVYERYRKCLAEKWRNDKRKPTWYGKHERTIGELAHNEVLAGDSGSE